MGLFRVLGFPATDQTRVVIGSLDNMASTLLFQTRRVERTVSGRGQGGWTMKKRKACYMVDRHNHHQPWMPHCQVLAGWQKTGWFSRPSIESPWIDIDNNWFPPTSVCMVPRPWRIHGDPDLHFWRWMNGSIDRFYSARWIPGCWCHKINHQRFTIHKPALWKVTRFQFEGHITVRTLVQDRKRSFVLMLPRCIYHTIIFTPVLTLSTCTSSALH